MKAILDVTLPARIEGAESRAARNRSLIGGLQCLEAVAAAGQPVTAADLASSLGMLPGRVRRLLETLAHLGLLAQTQTGAYRPGPGIHTLAALSLRGSPLLEVALPYAKRWWADGFVVTVGVLWREQVCHLLHARPEWPFERAMAGHEVSPASWSTAGVALLAARPESETADLVQPGLPQWRDPSEPLADVLAATRLRRYARREFRDGRVSLGVAIGEPAFAGFAVSRLGVTEAVLPDVLAGLHETAAAIAEQTQHASRILA